MALLANAIGRALRATSFKGVACMVIVGTLVITALGYRAIAEWQRSTDLLIEERTSEVVTLMMMAINRDMRAVQQELLSQLGGVDTGSALYALADEVAMAFSRFPYPESFFSWTAAGDGPETLYVFNRSDRMPHWHTEEAGPSGFPVTILKDPPRFTDPIRLLRTHASALNRVAFMDTTIDGHEYQVIAQLRYGGPMGTTLQGLFGFTVNIDWVREHYFSELLDQLTGVLAGQGNIVLSVIDENGAVVAGARHAADFQSKTPLIVREHVLPLLFFEPLLQATTGGPKLQVREWSVRATAIAGESSPRPAAGSRSLFVLISIAAVASGVGVIITARAVHTEALLATMKSEFVSTVTHDLKAPLASIRLASETLARGRLPSQAAISEYTTILLNEASSLTRTIDNLLAVARLHDVEAFYSFDSIDLATVVEEVLSRFHTRLKETGFEVTVDLPEGLAPIRADRTAIVHVLDNVLDNAIRYTEDSPQLRISASNIRQQVVLRIQDSGRGIPHDELPRVFDKFFRGRHTTSGGSGLGLAIARKVIQDHHGNIELKSEPGLGTTVEISLPAATTEANR